MSEGDFLVWKTAYMDGMCVIGPPNGIQKGWQLRHGISRLDGWPVDVFCKMSDEFPDDLEIGDSVHGATVLVVSKRLKEFVVGSVADNLEFLPLKIKNHKGRLASNECFILNPLTLLDCINIEASGVNWNNIDKNAISTCAQLVIDSKRVPENSKLFRLTQMPSVVVISADLAGALEREEFMGPYFVPTEEFTGF